MYSPLSPSTSLEVGGAGGVGVGVMGTITQAERKA